MVPKFSMLINVSNKQLTQCMELENGTSCKPQLPTISSFIMNQRLLTISKMYDIDYTIFLDSVNFHERLLLQNYEWENGSSMRKKSFLRQVVNKTLLYCMVERKTLLTALTYVFTSFIVRYKKDRKKMAFGRFYMKFFASRQERKI